MKDEISNLLNIIDLQPKEVELADKNQEEMIRKWTILLTPEVEKLIREDFNELLNILYRIDVSESKLNTALKNQNPEESSAMIISKLIVERQFQKMIFRKIYEESKKKLINNQPDTIPAR